MIRCQISVVSSGTNYASSIGHRFVCIDSRDTVPAKIKWRRHPRIASRFPRSASSEAASISSVFQPMAFKMDLCGLHLQSVVQRKIIVTCGEIYHVSYVQNFSKFVDSLHGNLWVIAPVTSSSGSAHWTAYSDCAVQMLSLRFHCCDSSDDILQWIHYGHIFLVIIICY